MKNANFSIETAKRVYYFINLWELGIMSVHVNGKCKEQFAISGIHVFNNNLADIGFTRTFADMIMPEQYVTDCKIGDGGEVIIKFGDAEYSYLPRKGKENKKPCTLDPKAITIDTFMSYKFIDGDKIKVDGSKVYMPVSAYQIGTTDRKQETAIRRLMENVLDGAQVKYQCCRVPAFTVEFNGDAFKIYGHIHDLSSDKPLNTVLIYDSENDFTGVNPYEEFIKYAKIHIY